MCFRAAVRLAMVMATGAMAQVPPDPALEWTIAQRSRIGQMKNPVVVAHGTGGLAALVCRHDPVTAAGLFREAIAASLSIADGAFTQRGTTVLPAASFTGLWKYVSSAALKCDPALADASASERARQRMEKERRDANSTLSRAYAMLSADRSDQNDRTAQIANAALDAGDPETLDIGVLTLLLSQLRERAPDLADDVFLRALDFVNSAVVPDPANLQELGKFLFTSPKKLDRSDIEQAGDSEQVAGTTVENLTATRNSTNPDDVQAYIEAAIHMFEMPGAASRNATVAYSVALQLIPRARDLLPNRVDDLQKVLDGLQVAAGSAAASIQSLFGAGVAPDPESGDPATRDFWLSGQIRSLCAGSQFAEARSVLRRIDDTAARGEVSALVNFYESAQRLERKDLEAALPLANGLRPGVKRTLLYAGMMTASAARDTTVEILQLADRDAERLPAELRIRLFSALAASAMPSDPETALMVATHVVTAYNDAYTSPRKGVFDPSSLRKIYNPKADTSTDSALVLPGGHAFSEAVQLEKGRQNFPLKVPGVTVYSLAAFLESAKGADPARLEALILGLRDENRLVQSLLTLAGMRLR